MASTTTAIRPSAVAGQFYPSNASELRLQVEDMLGRAKDAEVAGPIRGLIAPHAGYPFSGQTAAAAYRQIRAMAFETVVIIAPSHRERCGISVYPGDAYETPLGNVQVDVQIARALASSNPAITLSNKGQGVSEKEVSDNRPRGEHAIEVHLPFLQVALTEFKIVPIVMDVRSFEGCKLLARRHCWRNKSP
jgi:AmmeMemoRadiSam system protein B